MTHIKPSSESHGLDKQLHEQVIQFPGLTLIKKAGNFSSIKVHNPDEYLKFVQMNSDEMNQLLDDIENNL